MIISKIEQFKKIILSMDYKYKILSIDKPIYLTENGLELTYKI